MKPLAIALFLFSLPAFSAPRLCEVYGISDSPQQLDCKVGGEDLQLRCRNGAYFLNSSKVDVAYHEEVEDGPVPLIFRTAETKLKVLIHSARKIDAELSRKDAESTGNCRP